MSGYLDVAISGVATAPTKHGTQRGDHAIEAASDVTPRVHEGIIVTTTLATILTVVTPYLTYSYIRGWGYPSHSGYENHTPHQVHRRMAIYLDISYPTIYRSPFSTQR